MTAAWMAYALLVAALTGVAALAAERAARVLGRPSRWVWAAAMLATLGVPSVAALLPPDAAPADSPGVVTLAPVVVMGAEQVAARGMTLLAALDRSAAAAWILSSGTLALLLARALVLLHRRRRGWSVRRVHGVTLLVAPDAGPAVVGLRRMDVVLPEWALALDGRLLAMMLRHESEHVAARDPLLLLAAGLALVLMPWNLALWWQARRLRLAIEVDCDARVLRAHGDVERYGLLLLAVAQRRQRPASLFSPALLEPVSLLERRIAAMTARPARRPWLVAAGTTAVAAAALFAACSAPAPDVAGDVTAPRATLAGRDVPPPPAPPDAPPAPPLPGDTVTVNELRPSKATVAAPPHGTQEVAVIIDSMSPAWPRELQNVPVVRDSQLHARARDLLARTRERRAALEARGEGTEQVVRAGSPATPELERAVVRELTRAAGAGTPTLVPADQPYFEFQVEKPVLGAANTVHPRYPAELKAARVEGEVMVQFVVDTSGRAEPGTFKVLKSTDGRFTDAVQGALPQMLFVPAEVAGRRVRQLVQQSFVFALSR